MKHIIISRAKFEDKDLFKVYLKITKEVLVPCIKSQKNKNFTWAMTIYREDFEFTRDYLQIDFMPFFTKSAFIDYTLKNDISIQTRHDIDDFMSEDYVQKLQEVYLENINKYDKFLIQSQPVMLNFLKKVETKMKPYTETRNSMFLSLCQKKADLNIYNRKHNLMYEIAPHVITLPEGYTKWVIHGANISCKDGKVKT